MKVRLGFLILLFLLVLFPVSALASTWAKSYGGFSNDDASSIQQTSDGGFIVSGSSSSFGAGSHDTSSWILKLNANGNVIWQKTYGGPNHDYARSIQQTSDGGFIVAGQTNSYGAGSDDFWILKLDADGNVVWQKTYGGLHNDHAYFIQQTSNGGFIVAGETNSYGVWPYEVWILKLDANGNVIWQKTYSSGSGGDYARSIQQTSDGGFIVAGSYYSSGTSSDFWILKLDANGNVIWQKTYGGSDSEGAQSIQQTSDGGYIVAGRTHSFGAGDNDIWILKLNANGNVIWQKTYGGSEDDRVRSIQQTSDGGFIVAGSAESFGAGKWDFWILKLNANGNVIWQKTYGGYGSDNASSIQQTSDGGFIVSGSSSSFGAGSDDFWILKLDADGNIPGCGRIKDTSVVPSISNVNPNTTGIIPKDTDAAVSNTAVVQKNTDAYVEAQCSYFAPFVVPQVAAGDDHTVGLKSNGTVVAVGDNSHSQLNVGSWPNVKQVAAGGAHTVGLKSDGTVVAVGRNDWDQCNVSSWTDIVHVAAGYAHTIGVKSDGTVVALGYNGHGQLNVSSWSDIIQGAAGNEHTVGLKSDGTVVAVGRNNFGELNVSSWTNIVQVSAGSAHTLGLKSEGTVVAVGRNDWNQCNVGSWTNIKQVAGGGAFTVGLKPDGTVVGVGINDYGQLNFGNWTNIFQVAAGAAHTVGLKPDGTVLAVGSNGEGQCNVSNWNLLLFGDVPSGHWAYEAIYKIYNTGITKGCSVNPLLYCIDKSVSKAAMATFLLRSLHGGDYTPPDATGNIFTDVDVNEWYAPWVEQLYKEGITKGCSESPLMYCPDRYVSKASMAIFLLRSKYGVGYIPPAATGIFTDVPLSHWGADWIEQLYKEGITSGCSAVPLMYCPDRAVSRAAMALFLVRTFGL